MLRKLQQMDQNFNWFMYLIFRNPASQGAPDPKEGPSLARSHRHLWSLEGEDVTQGGPIRCGARLRLRSLASRRYLSVRLKNQGSHIVLLEEESESADTENLLFTLEELKPTSAHLCARSFFLLRHRATGLYLGQHQRNEMIADTGLQQQQQQQ